MELIIKTDLLTTALYWLSANFQKIKADMASDCTSRSMEREFSDIIADNNQLIERICFYYASDSKEYEDLLQDVYINIWRGLENFREESRKSTWIYRICLNTCVSSWRRNSRHKNSLSIDSIVEPCEEDGCRSEALEQLHYLISLLNPAEKSLLMMWLDERSYDEIAEVTGFNRNTVATKLRRIKEKLAAIAESKHYKI